MGAIIDQNRLAQPPSLRHHPKYFLIYATLLFLPYIHLVQLKYALRKYKVRQSDIDYLYNDPYAVIDCTTQKSIKSAFESHSRFQSWCKVVRIALAVIAYMSIIAIPSGTNSSGNGLSSLEIFFYIYAGAICMVGVTSATVTTEDKEDFHTALGPAFLISLLHENEGEILRFYALRHAPMPPILCVFLIEGTLFYFHMYSHPNPLDINIGPGLFFLGVALLILMIASFIAALVKLGKYPCGFYNTYTEGMRELGNRLQASHVVGEGSGGAVV